MNHTGPTLFRQPATSCGPVEFDEPPYIRSRQQPIARILVVFELTDWPFSEGAWQPTGRSELSGPCLAKSPNLRFLFLLLSVLPADRRELVLSVVFTRWPRAQKGVCGSSL